MATRLYLTNVADPDSVTITFGNPEMSVRRLLSPTKQGAVTSRSITAGGFKHAGGWISPPVATAVTISGLVTFCVGIGTAGTSRDVYIPVSVIPGSGATGLAVKNDSSNLYQTTTASYANVGVSMTKTPSPSISVSVGQRLVIAPGVSVGSGSAASVYYGGTGSDLTGGGDATTLAGWVEFAETISFSGGGGGGPSIAVRTGMFF